MVWIDVEVLIAATGLLVSVVSLVLVVAPSLLGGVALGLVLGVLLAPAVRRASVRLERYLRS